MVATHRQHPTLLLAFIVTTSLVVAFATVATLNQQWLIPRYWVNQQPIRYASWLIAAMLIGTALALTIIRTAYLWSFGPDADPYGLSKHYVIDLFGMVVHVAGSAWITQMLRRRLNASHTASNG